MTAATAIEVAVALVALGLAVWVIVVRETYTAVVGFLAFGLLVALVWARLQAVDVALTEAAIGGLSGVLMLGAAARLRATAAGYAAERAGAGLRLAAAALSTAVAAGLAAAVLLLPDPAPTLAPEAVANIAAIGLGNPVTAALMTYRATDTLLEKVVLVLALAGVWSFARDAAWGGRPGPRHQADPHGALVLFARWLPPVGILVGIYILWVSADAPGGAFQGGAIIAAMWMLVMMAGLADAPPIASRRLRLALVAGPGVFMLAGLVGLWFGTAFLAYPPPPSLAKAIIVAIEVPMLATLAATLGLLLAGAPERDAETGGVNQ